MISSLLSILLTLGISSPTMKVQTKADEPTDGVVLRKSYATVSFFHHTFPGSPEIAADGHSLLNPGTCTDLVAEVPIVQVKAGDGVNDPDIANLRCTEYMITSPDQTTPRAVDLNISLVVLIHPDLQQKSFYLFYYIIDPATGEYLSSSKNYSSTTHDLNRVDMDMMLDDYPFEGSPKVDAISFMVQLNDAQASLADGVVTGQNSKNKHE